MRGIGRTAAAAAAAVVWLSGCRDVADPEGGVLAISPVQLPAPGLVAGDTLRDSTGAVAPLRVVAYNTAGDTITPTPPTAWVVLDDGARLVGPLLIGITAGTTVRVVGTVGALQTPPDSVRVTLSPDTLVAADSTLHRARYALTSGDTVVNSADLATRVLHVEGTSTSNVDAVIVRYEVVAAPPARAGASGPTVILRPGTGTTARDTTTDGRAAVTARLRIGALASAPGTDTAIVDAVASYRGQAIGRVTFTVVFITP